MEFDAKVHSVEIMYIQRISHDKMILCLAAADTSIFNHRIKPFLIKSAHEAFLSHS